MKKIIWIFSFLILLVPGTILASGDLGMGGLGAAISSTSYKGQNDLSTPIGNVIQSVLALAGTIFLVLLIYGGVTWMTAAGNSEKVDKAKDVIIAAVIGGAIVASAYTITYFVMLKLGNSNNSTNDVGDCVANIGGSQTTLEGSTQDDCSKLNGTWTKKAATTN